MLFINIDIIIITMFLIERCENKRRKLISFLNGAFENV